MADREQIWKIVADFSSLTSQSRRAARAVRELDDARESASKRKDREIFKPEEIDNVDKMTAALQGTVQARRAEARQLKIHQARLEGLNQSIEGNTRATNTSTSSVRASTAALQGTVQARRAETRQLKIHQARLEGLNQSIEGNTRATNTSTSSVSASTAAISNHGKAVRSANKDHNALSRSMSRGSSTARNAGQNVGFLTKAFADILPASRSWALFMKMIPLTAVTSGVNTLLPAVAGLGGAFVGLAGTIGPVIGLLGALPTMFVAAAGGIGGLIAGLGGIVGAMSAYNTMTEAQGKAEFKSATASKSAARSRERSLRSTARSLERAKRDRIEAARDIKDAETALAETAVTNARNIARAEDAVADAHQDVARAQKAVTDARRDAANALDDYRLKLRGAALDEEGAVLALKQARAQLAEAMIDPGTSALEQKQANLAVRQAELRLDEVREANKDLAKEAADAQAKGIEGSDLVVDAKEREIDAQEAARDAQIGLQDAYKDSAKATQAAQRSLEDSKQAYIDSGERVVELQETLADLKTTIEETGEAADPAATQIAAFEAAMAKLTPEARAVVKELIALKDAWGGIQESSQQAMAPGLLSFLQDLRFKLLPFISIFVTRMAKGAGDFFEAFGDLITTRASLEAWSEIFVDAEHFMSLLGEATLNVTEWLLGLGRAAYKSGLTVWIGEVIRNWTKGWKKAVDTPTGIDAVAESMKDSMFYAEQWGEAISQVWKFFRTFFKGFRPLGLWTLQNIRDTAEAWNNFLKSPGGQDKLKLWQGLAKVNLTGLANMVKVITDQGPKMFGDDMRKGTENFQAFWDALNGTTPDTGFINALGDLLGIVDAEMITNILGLGESIAGMLQSLGENGGMRIVIEMVNIFEKFANIVDGLFQTVPGLASSVMVLLSVLSAKKLIVALGQLTGANLITTAMNSARAQGYGGKNKAMVGATVANFMGFGNMVPDQSTEGGTAIYASRRAADAESRSQRAAQRKADKALVRANMSGSVSQYNAAKAALVSLPNPGQISRMGKLTSAANAAGKAVGLLGAAFIGVEVGKAAFGNLLTAAPGIDRTAAAMDRLAKASAGNKKVNLDSLFKNANNSSQNLAVGVGSLREAFDSVAWRGENALNGFISGADTAILGIFGMQSGAAKVDQAFNQIDQTLSTLSPQDLAANFKLLEQDAKNAGLTTEELLQKIPKTAEETKQALLAASDGMHQFKTGPEEVAEVLRGNLPEGLVMTEQGLMNVTQAAKQNLKPIDKNTIATEEFKAALEEQEGVMRDAINAYKDAKDAVQGLNDAQRDASGLFMSEQEAADRYATTLSELSQAIEDNGTSAKGQSEGAIANREYLRGLATDARDYTDSLLANGASVDDVNAKMLLQRAELLKVLESFGIVGKEAEAYADKLGLIPNYVDTLVAVKGSKLAQDEADRINVLLMGLPDETRAEILTVANSEGYDQAVEMLEAAGKLEAEATIYLRTKLTQESSGRVVIGSGFNLAKADGGYIEGPGTTTSDSIPALLSDKEYVVRASATSKIGVDRLNYMNRTGRLPGYARGGLVGAPKFAAGGSVGGAITISTTAPLEATWGPALIEWWDGLWKAVGSNTGTAWSGIKGKVKDGWDATVSYLKGQAPGLGTWWSGIWKGVTTTLSNAWTTSKSGTKTFVEGFQNIFHQLQSVVRGPLSSIVSFVNTTLGGLVNGVASFFGVKSPFPISVSTSMPASAKVAIKGFSDGGWTGPGGRLQPVGVVHGDEYVIKKSSRQKIERKNPGLLDHMNRTGSPGYADGGRVRPVSGRESGNYKGHSGIDYAVPVGTPVRSPEAGVVSYTRRMTTSFGNHIVQSFSSGFRGVFAHLSRMAVEAGDKVSKGQVVGYSGNTGNSTGPHLHFEVTRGSLGAAANREVTRSWLSGASSSAMALPDGKKIVDSGSGIWDQIFNMAKNLANPLATLRSSLGISGFGQLLGASAGKFVDWSSKKAQDLFKALGVSGPLDNIAQVIGNFTGATQRDNAFGIADVAQGRGMGKRGALLGIMAAMQESGLKNINYGDRDSVGLFQQRPSAGWGTIAQIMNPSYAANKFFAALAKVKGWMTGPEWQDIQAVQISAFPTAYQKHKTRAQQYVDEWAKARGYADGGWTGPGSRLQPAGVVHADEYVINKGSRRRLERTAPGLLDHLNTKGTLPGYATGGAVTPWDGKSYPGSSAFRLGKSHPAVTLLGKMLVKKGFGRHYRVGPGPTFTSADLKNMQEYQRSQGWSGTSANGYPGTTSWSRLYSAYSPTVAAPKPTAAATTSAIPTSLKGLTVFLSYLEKAQLWDATHGVSNTLFETRRQTQLVSSLLNKEGLLASSAVDGHFGTAEAAAWKKWQAKNSMTETGIVDADSLAPLLSKYGVAFNKDIPFAPGFEQPSRFDVISGSLTASNKTLAEYMGYLGKIRAWGFSNVFETLKGLGPNGIPEEYRDSENPMTGMEMAKMLSASVTAARQYEEALREAARLGGEGDGMSKKMGEMVDLLMWGLDGPYGLQSAAKTLGVSMDTAALLYKKITEQGSLKDVPTTRTARIRNDVADFDNLFKFAKGGIVPGVGNRDSVMAMLTPGEMVIPKSVVAEMFRSTPSVTPFLNLASRISGRSDTTGTGNGGNTYEFHTNVYNPVAEESSMSVQKRVKSLANLGMLGGRRS